MLSRLRWRHRVVGLTGLTVGSLSAGCIASKGDVRLVQDATAANGAELRGTRDSLLLAIRGLQVALRDAMGAIGRLNDSVQSLKTSLVDLRASNASDLNDLNDKFTRLAALSDLIARNLQDTRLKVDVLREQSASGSPAAADTTHTTRLPGPAVLFSAGKEQLENGAYRTARQSFDLLLTTWPTSPDVPRAQFYVGVALAGEGRRDLADSVFRLVVSRFPRTPEAPDALYRHATFLIDRGDLSGALTAIDRLLKDYPTSDAAPLARDLQTRLRR